MFWILNKKENTPAICGSIPAVVKLTGIMESRLKECFSRKKLQVYNTETWRIERKGLLVSPRKKQKGTKKVTQ